MKQLIKRIIEIYLVKQSYKSSKSFYDNAIRYNPQLKEPTDGEKEWLEKWRQYDPKLSPMAYRVFSRYIGPNMDIVPLEVCSSMCEPVLTPYHFNNFYADKNTFDLIFPSGTLPKTYLRKIGDRYYDEHYHIIPRIEVLERIKGIEEKSLIVKPSISSSGMGVVRFSKKDDLFYSDKHELLSLDFLDKYFKRDCIVQESFQQHYFFSRYNSSSVNTLRVASYRDSEGNIQILNSILRIGLTGSVVDNAHAGGMFVGVSSDGFLGNYVCDQYGRIQSLFNGIDFSKETMEIPMWGSIKTNIKEIAQNVIHHDLVAWDIVVDQVGQPHILEFNVGGFSGWLFQFTSGPMFGSFTEDVMKTVVQRTRETQIKVFLTRK